jgi:hypothetical protein
MKVAEMDDASDRTLLILGLDSSINRRGIAAEDWTKKLIVEVLAFGEWEDTCFLPSWTPECDERRLYWISRHSAQLWKWIKDIHHIIDPFGHQEDAVPAR